MGKLIISLFLFLTICSAETYKTNCLKCHKHLPVSIDKYFYRYLLKYSSEKSVKQAIFKYLKNPKRNNTIMPKAFVKRFGIKNKTNLNNKELKSAINTYWKTYKVFGKLK